jgi:hypothetical protein
MSEYELTSLVYEVFRDMDRLFEFWLTCTFAVIVARFVAGNRLSRPLLWLVAIAYLATAVRWAARWVILGERAMVYRERLVESGFADIPQARGPIVTSEGILFFLFLIVTAATVYFCIRSPAPPRDERVEDSPRH